jgi:predicted nuclease with TOPRIM domain
MAEEGLKIKIGADVVEVVQSLNQLQTEFNDLNKQIKNVVPGSTQFNELSRQLAFTEAKIKGVNAAASQAGASLKNNFTGASNQATFALTNFSRVASDAPFGIIGIANNIDPLVQSFVSLRKETGSGKAALAALTSSLAGGGGLILGISLLTSALQFVQLGFSRWGASAKQAKEDQDKLKQGTDQLITSVTKQRVEFESLVNIARNVANSEKDRTTALQRLNEILPDTIGKLNAQNIATAEGARITLQYIKAIESRATAELLINRIAENNVKLFDNRNNALSKSADIENKLIAARVNYNKALTATVPNYQVIEAYASDIENLEKKREQIQKEGRDIAQQVLNDNAKLRAEYERQLPAVNSLTVKNTQNSNVQTKTKKTVDEIGDLLKQYSEQLKGINWDEQNRQIDGTKKRLELAGETLRTFYVQGVKETSSAWIKVKSDFDKFQSDYDKFLRDQRLKEVNEGVSQLRTNIGSLSDKELLKGQENLTKGLQKVGAQFLANYELQQKGLKDLQKKNEELANTITGFLSPALEGVFESLVKGEDPFESLKNSVEQLIIQLGKAVIQSLILKAVTSAIGGPAFGVAGQTLGLGTIRGDAFSFLLSRGR